MGSTTGDRALEIDYRLAFANAFSKNSPRNQEEIPIHSLEWSGHRTRSGESLMV